MGEDTLKKTTNFIGDVVDKVTGKDIHRRSIEIYRLVLDLKTPLNENPNKIANCKIGDFVLIIGDEVWIQDSVNDKTELFSMASYGLEFVKANTLLFERI